MVAGLAKKFKMSPGDKRRFRRVELILKARFMLPDRSEHEATLLNISAGGIALRSTLRPLLGMFIIVYIQDIGRLEGKVVRHFSDGFALAYETSQRHRDRVVDKLTCKINPGAMASADDRIYSRVETNELANLILSDGREIQCRVLDISLGGVSLALDEKPRVGELIMVGRMKGRVVRHHEHGIGVAFDAVHQTSWGSLAQSLKRPSSPPSE
jgi:PilZ domain